MPQQRRLPFTFPVFAAILCGLCFCRQSHAADVPFERRLPDQVTLLVRVPSATEFSQRFSECSLGRLVDDPALANAIPKIVSTIEQSMLIRMPGAGLSFEQLLGIPDGEVAVAIGEPTNGLIPIVGLVEFGEKDDAARSLVDGIEKAAHARGATSRQSVRGNASVTLIEWPPSDRSDRAVSRRRLAFTLLDGSLVASNSQELLHAVLDRWDGSQPGSLADSPRLQRVVELSRTGQRSPCLFWYADPVAFFKAFAKAYPTEGQPTLMQKLSLFGFDGLRAVGGTIDLAASDLDSISRTVGLVRGPPQGVLAMLQFEPAELSIPAWVPADAEGCTVLKWDADAAFHGFSQLADRLMPAGHFSTLTAKLATDENGPRIDLKRDIVDQLTGRVTIVQGRNSDARDRAIAPVLFAFQLQSEEAVRDSLRRFGAWEKSGAKSETIAGLHTLSINPDADGDRLFTVAHGELLLCSDRKLLENAIEFGITEKSLKDDPNVKSTKAMMPVRQAGIGFRTGSGHLQSLYSGLRLLLSEKPKDGETPATKESLLPEFAEIAKHIQPSATWIESTGDGFRYVTFTRSPSLTDE